MENNQANSLNTGKDGMLGNLASMVKNVNVDQLPDSVKQFGSNVASRFNTMSTTQKVVGGALVAAGLYYLNNRTKSEFQRKNKKKSSLKKFAETM